MWNLQRSDGGVVGAGGGGGVGVGGGGGGGGGVLGSQCYSSSMIALGTRGFFLHVSFRLTDSSVEG